MREETEKQATKTRCGTCRYFEADDYYGQTCKNIKVQLPHWARTPEHWARTASESDGENCEAWIRRSARA
jgi:hypothetical protein